MSSPTHQQILLDTLVAVTDTFTDDFDIVEFLHDLADRCATLFDAVDVGIVLADSDGTLQVLAATAQRAQHLEALQLSTGAGPCLDSYRSGTVITAAGLEEITERWPLLAEGARRSGYESVHAIPLRLRDDTIGSLNLFHDSPRELDPVDAATARTIADLATIGLIQERALRESRLVQDQLRRALDSRMVVEQAKGVIARHRNVDVATAWKLLRDHARFHQTRVTSAAQAIIDGHLTL